MTATTITPNEFQVLNYQMNLWHGPIIFNREDLHTTRGSVRTWQMILNMHTISGSDEAIAQLIQDQNRDPNESFHKLELVARSSKADRLWPGDKLAVNDEGGYIYTHGYFESLDDVVEKVRREYNNRLQDKFVFVQQDEGLPGIAEIRAEFLKKVEALEYFMGAFATADRTE